MPHTYEVQCDGLIAPTHNYAGLGIGNVASSRHARTVAYPRQAALQGLEKMRQVSELGVEQIILPPPSRPTLDLLQQCGVSLQRVTHDAYSDQVVRAAWSASAMWAANAATITPAADAEDGQLHITPANLCSSLHRAQEAQESYQLLTRIFGGVANVHAPLPACYQMADEGAANHMRLCDGYGQPGVNIFVYGRDAANPDSAPKRHMARQSRHACEALARLHRLPANRTVMTQQHPDAIDAGVFHNDVIAMSNERLLITHEYSFARETDTLDDIRSKAPFALQHIRLSNADLPLDEVIASYFFNSQLLSLPDGRMAMIAPLEVQEHPNAARAMEQLRRDDHCPVETIYYRDIRESMRNGGGPACLRLRIVLDDAQLSSVPERYRFSPQRYDTLCHFVEQHYPESLAPEQLYDATLARELRLVHDELQALFV
jgi:succinylarginine dihydrolase